MHESAIAHSLLEAILAEAAKQNATPVRAKISCGAFDAVNDELLSFAFEAIARDTVCDGMELAVEHKPVMAKCRKCEDVFEFDLTLPACPKCRSDFDLLPDEPLLLQTIEFETE